MPNDYKLVQRQTAQYDLFNRLHSISSDSAFVQKVAADYNGRFDVIPNQRCGTWYCDPSSSSTTYAYFKSTDGHTGNWGFNMRRSNLPFAELAEKKGGVILVDSTRRGKRMPDALSKTVPIWCAVINRAVARRRRKEGNEVEVWDVELYTPPNVVSPSEKAQIEDRLDGWAEALETSTLALPDLNRPLRPFWVHPSTTQLPQIPSDPPFTPIICVSASRWVGSEDDVPAVTKLDRRTAGFSYVQGAGDDDELWSKGLNPAIFYQHKERLLAADRDDLTGLAEDLATGLDGLVFNLDTLRMDDTPTGVPGPKSKLALSIGTPTSSLPWQYDTIHTIGIISIDKPRKGESPIHHTSSHSSIFACPSARSHPGAYTHALDDIVDHVEDLLDEKLHIVLRPGSADQLKQAIALADGESLNFDDTALSPADAVEGRRTILPIALALLLSIPDLADSLGSTPSIQVDKGVIADMLHQLVTLWPDGNPPRAALRRVNEYLMSKRE